MGQADAIPGEPIQIWSSDFTSVAPQITVPQVIRNDQKHIGLSARLCAERYSRAQKDQQNGK